MIPIPSTQAYRLRKKRKREGGKKRRNEGTKSGLIPVRPPTKKGETMG